MEIAEFFATFGSGVFILIVIVFCVISGIHKTKVQNDKQREKQAAEEYKQRSAEKQSYTKTTAADEQRRQTEKMRQIARTFGLQVDDEPTAKANEQARKHQKHVEDSHEHGHLGEEEHYEEIVGSLGEVNDEGCEDLSGVRFIATDLAYELQASETVDYDRLAQAMVLGEVLNHPRFKQPYSRRK